MNEGGFHGAGGEGAPAHRLALRVYHEDTDAGGIVYHASYLRFAERGRTEFLRAAGFARGALARHGAAGFVVRRMEVDFRAAARLDDALVVATELERVGGASLDMAQAVTRGDETLVRLAVHLALVAASGRPLRLPAALRRALSPLARGRRDGDRTRAARGARASFTAAAAPGGRRRSLA